MMDVYVSNLRHDVTEDDLKSRLGDIGMVSQVIIHRHLIGESKPTFAVVTLMPAHKIQERSKDLLSCLMAK